MRKSVLAVFSLLSLSLLGIFASAFSHSIEAHAEDENKVTISCAQEPTKGSYYYAYVYIDSLENIASLNVSVHYDSSVVTIYDNYNQVSCAIYDSSVANDAVNYSYIFNAGGEAYQTSLFFFYYKINETTNLDKSYFDIVISDAYNSSLESVDVSGSRLYFNINDAPSSSRYCYVYGTSSINTSMQEEFEISYRFNTYEVASGTLEIQYDKELFEFVSLTQLDFLDGKLVDVNSSLDSSVMLSFVGIENAHDIYICRVKFRTISNVTANSQIKLVPTDLYDLELNSISCNGYTSNVNVSYNANYDENISKMFLASSYDEQNDEITILVKLSSNSNLGAGDFVLSWDKDKVSYCSSTKKFSPSFFNVNDKNVANGQFKFSIISLEDITGATDVIEVTFDALYTHDNANVIFEISGSGLSDSLTNPIQLNFVNCSQTVTGRCSYGDWTIKVSPTCTEDGIEHRLCSICNNEETRSAPATGHDWEDEWTIDVAPTCTVDGSKSHHCKNCNEKKDVTVIKKTGHSYGDWTIKVSPTCTADGSEHRICSVCGHEEIRVVAAHGHSWQEEWTIDVAPTCTSEGSKSHHCAYCNEKKDITTISKTAHIPAESVGENEIEATCTSEGSYDLVTYCKDCHTELSREHKTVEPHDHTYGEWSVKTAPTCVLKGQEHRICSVCGHEDIRSIDATGHDWDNEWTVDVQPTCTSDGSKSHHCKNCNEKKDVTVIEKTGHSYGEWTTTKSPTCTEAGSEHRICSVCDHEDIRSIEANGHDWEEEWTIDVAPTCTSEGSKSHHCKNCDEKKDVTVIEKTEHIVTSPVKENEVAPTCTTSGSYDLVTYCKDCQIELSREHITTDANGHSYGDWIKTKDPTCLEAGEEKRVCSICGYVETRQIEAAGHDWEEEWTIDVAPTCTSEGSKSHHCKNCDEKKDVTVIEKTEHTYGEWITVKEPSLTEPGEEKHVCSVCGHEETREIEKIDASSLFNECVNSIDLDKDSPDVLFEKIKQAIEYYKYIDDKATVSETYSKLQTIVNSYNAMVNSMNETHAKVSSNVLEVVIGIAAGISVLGLALFIIRKGIIRL